MAEQREKKARSPSSRLLVKRPALPDASRTVSWRTFDDRPWTCELGAKSLISRMSETAVVHIIDDDESVRAALDGLLSSVGFTPVPHASVSEFLAAKKPDVPGCLVLDVRMPGISGLDFQEELCGLGIHLPVILMTGHGDIRMSVRGMKAGAVDFLTKPFREQDMLDAVATAVRRDRARRDAEAVIVGLREKFAALSPREREVMRLVTAGKMNKEVAADLGLSEITVKVHRGAAMRKMAAPTLADLVRMAKALQLGNRDDEPSKLLISVN